jgi:hypothetical protein
MRRTKAQLESMLESAIRHQMMQMRVVTVKREGWLRNQSDFVPSHQYGYGQVPEPHEVGRRKGIRYTIR